MEVNPYASPKSEAPAPVAATRIARIRSFGTDHIWRLEVGDWIYAVHICHAFWTGKTSIIVNGEVVFHRPRKYLDWGFRQSIVVNDTTITIVTTPGVLRFCYDLLADETVAKLV